MLIMFVWEDKSKIFFFIQQDFDFTWKVGLNFSKLAKTASQSSGRYLPTRH